MESKQKDSSVDFCLGIIGDPQYADCESHEIEYMGYRVDPKTGTKLLNFDDKRIRNYRNSLDIVREASKTFLQTEKCVCTVVLGDIIDKQARFNNTYAECRKTFLETILSHHTEFQNTGVKSGTKKRKSTSITPSITNEYLFCFGNNDADLTKKDDDSSSRKEWIQHFIPMSLHPTSFTPDKIYYDYVPAPGYRIIILDCFDINYNCGSTSENKTLGLQLLNDNNPSWNDFSISYEAKYNNFPVEKIKFQKYNGGIGKEQLKWLESVLENSQSDIVICCGHVPLHPDSTATIDGFLYNNIEVMDMFKKHTCVKAYICGHDHDGGYSKCPITGIHYIIPRAPIECGVNQTAYGYLNFFSDKSGMELVWFGETPVSKELFQWPDHMKFR